ncbi:ABC transporter ATP-binding protein [Paenibacillus alkalitolerans]|uniref:ABC transporter ATP-binding protein n=1 Tax=Paenibacillus alkalitolerans TaxID=2799335 RepID=UPI0018F2AD2E|nr:dipeptide/oligopeptide/nickel ABC transporter ATP-binding protein [Paenibacillus alkalitolerans]
MLNTLLQVNRLSKSYTADVKALTDVSFTVERGECLGIVGESGSGKSTLAKLILGLEKPDAGEIFLNGRPFHRLKGRELRRARKQVQVVFQDPGASLNPKLPIWKSVVEPLENYPEVRPPFLGESVRSKRDMAAILLNQVGLDKELSDRYPHQLSGGQKQRVAIARGISLHPDLLLCDEPTSSLDVSVQAQILNLLKELKEKYRLSYLFISHDIASVRFLCDRIAVLQKGRLVDLFGTDELFSDERHAYTRELAVSAAL